MDRAIEVSELDDNTIPALSIERYFKATPLGLVVLSDTPYTIWEAYGEGMQRIHGSMPFILGDWLNYGERVYGETYMQAVKYTDLRVQTLTNYKWVASRVPISLRKENLTWTHHSLVASLPLEEQALWLDTASKEDWPTAELRSRIKDALGESHGEWQKTLDKLSSLVEQSLGCAEHPDDIAALRLIKDLLIDMRERGGAPSGEGGGGTR